LKVDNNISTLFDLKHKKMYKAESGKQGRGKKMHGRNGKDIIINVPKGTLVIDYETGRIIGDLKENEEIFIAAKGGRGGWGNSHFATPSKRTPDYARQGTAGEEKTLKLELKLLADVGLVGLPNAGKSTLLSKVSAARPKISDYPFTTIVPNLGIVKYYDYKSFVIADIPGLIKGAHLGKGLGDRFLRHIERTKILVIMLSSQSADILSEYNVLMKELKEFGHGLDEKPKICVITKGDLIEGPSVLPDRIDGLEPLIISSVTGRGIKELIREIGVKLFEGENG